MTPEQQATYERARADAELIYQLSMMETNAIVTRAQAPIRTTKPGLWHRFKEWLRSIGRQSDEEVASQ